MLTLQRGVLCNRSESGYIRYAEEAAEVLETDLYEVTAHRGARDKDKPHVWSNHKRWQGKVYATKDGSKYPEYLQGLRIGTG